MAFSQDAMYKDSITLRKGFKEILEFQEITSVMKRLTNKHLAPRGNLIHMIPEFNKPIFKENIKLG